MAECFQTSDPVIIEESTKISISVVDASRSSLGPTQPRRWGEKKQRRLDEIQWREHRVLHRLEMFRRKAINLKEVTKRSEIHPAIDYTASKFVQNDSDFKTWCQWVRYGWSESIFIIIFILNYFYPYFIFIH
jgi:hypothetical protein